MQDINNLINKLKVLIKEREEELKQNKFNEDMLEYEYNQLKIENSNINLEIANNSVKKSKIQNITKRMKQELIAAIILSIVSVSLVAFTSMMALTAILELSVIKSIIISILVTSISTPLIIGNETKEYKKLKNELGKDNLEETSEILNKKNDELNLNSNKQSLNRKKYISFKQRDKEIKTEINDFKVDIELLTAIKYMTIEESLKCNETLKKVLNDIANEQSFEEDKGYQKTKK